MTSSRPEQRKFASPSSQMTSSRCRDKSVNEVHAAAPPEKKNEILEDERAAWLRYFGSV